MRFSDATLMAFADGELSLEDAAGIEAALEADPGLAERVQRFRAVRRALRTVYDGVAAEPIPERLRALLGDVASSEAAPPPPVAPPIKAGMRRAFSAVSIAAIIAALIVGVMVGRLSAPGGERLFTENTTGMHAAASLARTLEDNLASSPDNADAAIRVGFTFRTTEGQMCRTFRRGRAAGLACRDADGWNILMLSNDAADIGAAGTPPVILALVDTMIDGDPMGPSEERMAQAQHWASVAPAVRQKGEGR